VGLDRMALLLGLPGKLGMSGEVVWDAWLAGAVAEIRDYCETDAINTYLIYLRFELLRGRLTPEEHARECGLVRGWLDASDRAHLIRFRDAWSRT
jgi:predicted PolB exonuclease-like 3'-5' exonuclease